MINYLGQYIAEYLSQIFEVIHSDVHYKSKYIRNNDYHTLLYPFQSHKTEEDVLRALPDKPVTLDVMIVTKILSQRGTRSLGDFEVQYIFEPEARKIVDE